MRRRARARDLAIAYYRLVRALHTGRTIPDPRNPEPTSVSLSELRRQFNELVPERPSETRASATPGDDTPPAPEAGREAPDAPDDDDEDDETDRILIEEIARLDAELERQEAAAEEEARVALEALGPANLAQLTDQIGDDRPAREVDAARDEAHTRAGARQAAAAARMVQNGARGTVWSTAERDQRVVGYVRYSTTGTPCGWCAMLISRGPVYRSERSATLSGGAASYDDGDKYHDNCNCIALPVFSREQFESSDLFALNRQYAEEWPRVTRGLSGKAAVSAWRYYVRQQQKSRAQAARPTQNVQEA
jgi:hypothetical protein